MNTPLGYSNCFAPAYTYSVPPHNSDYHYESPKSFCHNAGTSFSWLLHGGGMDIGVFSPRGHHANRVVPPIPAYGRRRR